MEFGNKKFAKCEKKLELLHGLWMMIVVVVIPVKIIPDIISHTSNVNISLSKHLGNFWFVSESTILSCVAGHKQPRNFA